jgi:hypothetical protein
MWQAELGGQIRTIHVRRRLERLRLLRLEIALAVGQDLRGTACRQHRPPHGLPCVGRIEPFPVQARHKPEQRLLYFFPCLLI